MAFKYTIHINDVGSRFNTKLELTRTDVGWNLEFINDKNDFQFKRAVVIYNDPNALDWVMDPTKFLFTKNLQMWKLFNNHEKLLYCYLWNILKGKISSVDNIIKENIILLLIPITLMSQSYWFSEQTTKFYVSTSRVESGSTYIDTTNIHKWQPTSHSKKEPSKPIRWKLPSELVVIEKN
jgi:hypothetical protein